MKHFKTKSFFQSHKCLFLISLCCSLVLKMRGIKQAASSNSLKPLFKFGVIADIQYIDLPDGSNFQKTKVRRYRQSLEIFKSAVKSWNLYDETLRFSIVLGDTLDGQTATMKNQDYCLDKVTTAMEGANFPLLFCYGNHDFYAFNREEIFQKLLPPQEFLSKSSVGGICTPQKLYYDFCPYPGYRAIILDSYDISLIGASSPENNNIAQELLSKNNPNDLKKSGNWFNNLPRHKYRWVPYNGGISTTQVQWLQDVLNKSKSSGEKVFIFCHQPIYAPLEPTSPVWNAEEILDILHDAGNVCLWMAGHDHDGQYYIDQTGIHHMVPPAPLECDAGQTAFGHIEVYEDRLKLCWTGKIPPRSAFPWPQDMAIKAAKMHGIHI